MAVFLWPRLGFLQRTLEIYLAPVLVEEEITICCCIYTQISTGYSTFEASQRPELNFDVISRITASPEQLVTSLVLKHGPPEKQTLNRLEVGTSGRCNWDTRALQLQQTAHLSWPYKVSQGHAVFACVYVLFSGCVAEQIYVSQIHLQYMSPIL